MKRRAILIGLGALITLHALPSLVFAGENEAIATMKGLGGQVLQQDFDPDKPPDLVAFWLRPALSDAEFKKAAAALVQLHGPRTLILDCTQVTDKGLAHLTGLTRLTELSLKATRVTDAGLKHLHRLTSLKKIDLRLTAVSQGGVEALKKALPRAVIEHGCFWCVDCRFDRPPNPLRWLIACCGESVFSSLWKEAHADLEEYPLSRQARH
jgi:hypothetical protein